jgi:hypothetical protein
MSHCCGRLQPLQNACRAKALIQLLQLGHD